MSEVSPFSKLFYRLIWKLLGQKTLFSDLVKSWHFKMRYFFFIFFNFGSISNVSSNFGRDSPQNQAIKSYSIGKFISWKSEHFQCLFTQPLVESDSRSRCKLSKMNNPSKIQKSLQSQPPKSQNRNSQIQILFWCPFSWEKFPTPDLVGDFCTLFEIWSLARKR